MAVRTRNSPRPRLQSQTFNPPSPQQKPRIQPLLAFNGLKSQPTSAQAAKLVENVKPHQEMQSPRVFDLVEFPAMPSKVSTLAAISPSSTPSNRSKKEISTPRPSSPIASLEVKVDHSPNGTHGNQKLIKYPGVSMATNSTLPQESDKVLKHASIS